MPAEAEVISTRTRDFPMRDPESGALNRALLVEAATPMVSLARRNARTMAFLHIHVAGLALRAGMSPTEERSVLVRDVTDQILTMVRDSDFVARVGPERFVVALTELWEPDAAARVAGRLVRSLGEMADGDRTPYLPRVGVSFFPADADCVDGLLGRAQEAVDRVSGATGIAFADPVVGAEALRRAGLERDLTGASQVDQFLLHYQPVFSMATGAVVGVESLIRWDHALQGLLTASDFIPLAERTGRIRALDQWSVGRAMADTRAWREMGWDGWVSMNLSGRTLSDPSIIGHVEDALQRTGTNPESVIFEVTENLALSPDGKAAEVLDELRGLGARIAIDDFGTGYASFEYLRDFDPDLVKLDRVFMAGEDHPRSHRLLHSLVLMAHNMGKPVVVEGLEEEAQRQRLVDSGCDMVQGYLLGRPVAPETLASEHLTPLA